MVVMLLGASPGHYGNPQKCIPKYSVSLTISGLELTVWELGYLALSFCYIL